MGKECAELEYQIRISSPGIVETRGLCRGGGGGFVDLLLNLLLVARRIFFCLFYTRAEF